jgi:hypothetical protein
MMGYFLSYIDDDRDIVIMGICSSHFDDERYKQKVATCWTYILYAQHMSYGYVMNINVLCPSHYDDRVMLITLQWQHYFSHYNERIFVSHCDNDNMFITLWWQGYVFHIVVISVCTSHCDDEVIFITLWEYGYVHHIARIWLWPTMVIYGKQV